MNRIAIVIVLAACSEKQAAKPALGNLKITVGGMLLAADRAFVKRSSQDVYTVLVGAGKGSCEALLDGSDPGTGKTFAFTVQKRVAHDGAERHVVSDVWSRDFEPKATLPADVTLAGTADPGTPVKLELALTGPSFSATGTVTAVGCGERPPTGAGVPKVPHPAKAHITVAGKDVPIRGVTVRVRPGKAATDLPNIVISTGPKDCSDVTLPAPVILERADGQWTLRGTWFDQPIAGTPEQTKNLAFGANEVGQSADGPTLQLQLMGSGRFGDYTAELHGTIEAIECVTGRP